MKIRSAWVVVNTYTESVVTVATDITVPILFEKESEARRHAYELGQEYKRRFPGQPEERFFWVVRRPTVEEYQSAMKTGTFGKDLADTSGNTGLRS